MNRFYSLLLSFMTVLFSAGNVLSATTENAETVPTRKASATVKFRTEAPEGTMLRIQCQPFNEQEITGLKKGKFLGEYIVEDPAQEVTITGPLEQLECYDAQITEIQLNAPDLYILKCYKNKISTLDLSQCPELARLQCGENLLTELNVQACSKLEYLHVEGNRLSNLDLSRHDKLSELYCEENNLSSITLKCPELSLLHAHKNLLTDLDLSQCPKLDYVFLFSNRITDKMDTVMAKLPSVGTGYIYIVNTRDTEEKNICLMKHVAAAAQQGWATFDYLNGIENPGGYIGAFYKGADYESEVGEGSIYFTTEKAVGSTINLELTTGSENVQIEGVLEKGPYSGAQTYTLASQEITIHGQITKFVANSDSLSSLTIEDQPKLTWVECSGNLIETLYLQNFRSLTTLLVQNNRLKVLNLSGDTALTRVECYQNDLKGIAMTSFVRSLPFVHKGSAALRVIDTMAENPIDRNVCTKANVDTAVAHGWEVYNHINGGNYGMGKPYAGSDPVVDKEHYFAFSRPERATTMITFKMEQDGAEPMVEGGEIKGWNGSGLTLDMTADTVFVYGDFAEILAPLSDLSFIDVSSCTNLTLLNVMLNQLETIDLSGCEKLDYLDCSFNHITSLRASSNPNLRTLVCNGNRIEGSDMDILVGSLPRLTKEDYGDLIVVDLTVTDGTENICSQEQVRKAMDKYWAVWDFNDGTPVQYWGYKDPDDPVDPTANEDKEITSSRKPVYDASQGVIRFAEPCTAEIFNATGRLMMRVKGESVNVSTLPSGLYIVRTSEYVMKFVL